MGCQIVKKHNRGGDRQLVNNFSETIPMPGYSARVVILAELRRMYP